MSLRQVAPAALAGLLVAVATVPSAGAADLSVEAGDFFYRPFRVSIAAGETVTWRILDGSQHSITARKGAPAQFDSGLKAPGETFAFRFTVPGRYPYYCTIHPGQEGVVQVGPDTTDPRLSRVRVRRGARSVRLRFRLSEEAKVKATIFRDGERIRTIKTRVLREGRRSILYRPGSLVPGRYRAKLSATDLEGNVGAAVNRRFSVPQH